MAKKGLDHALPYDSPFHSPQVQADNDGGDDIIYIGRAEARVKSSEPYWQIAKLLYSGGFFVRLVFADGNNTNSFIWNDRASYDYTPDDA